MATTLLLEGDASHWLPGGESCIERLTCMPATSCFPAFPHILRWPAQLLRSWPAQTCASERPCRWALHWDGMQARIGIPGVHDQPVARLHDTELAGGQVES